MDVINKIFQVPSSHKFATSAALAALVLFKKWKSIRDEAALLPLRPSRLVVISGCDSGLGLSMAAWSLDLGYSVLAGCLNPEGDGAKILKERAAAFPQRLKIAKLDVTDVQSVASFREQCEFFIQENGTDLWAVISNAGILVCAMFWWQTRAQWEKQFQVNFMGSLNLSKEFSQLLIKHKSRFIVVSSDCAKIALPALAVYAGTKSALEAWARGFRLEVQKYGITVVAYQPGNFPFSSQIFGNNATHYREIEESMTASEKAFYGKYFQIWKTMKCSRSNSLPPIHVLVSKRHQSDLKLLLEQDLRYTPVLTYEDWVQKLILYGEQYLPRRISDKLLMLMMDGTRIEKEEK